MRRLAIIAAALAALAVTTSAAAADIPLTVVSEDATTITLGWSARPAAYGFRFFRNDQPVSSTFDGSRTSVRFAKADSYAVHELLAGDRGSYPPPPPPPVDVCPNIDGVQTTIPPGMVKDASGNCVPEPPPSGNNLIRTSRWVCSSFVNYDLVKITITQSTQREDAVQLASGCNGRIGRLEIDTSASDGIHVGAGAHDLTVGGGYLRSHGTCVPACIALALPVARSSVAETRVVASGTPPKVAITPAVKFEPFRRSVKAPGATVLGELLHRCTPTCVTVIVASPYFVG